MDMKPKPVGSHPASDAPTPNRTSSEHAPRQRGDFTYVVSSFVREVDSLATALPLTMSAVEGSRTQARKEYNDFIAKHGRNDEGGQSVDLDIRDWLAFQRHTRNLQRSQAASYLVPRSFLVALVSQYDHFLGLLIETLLLTKPELLNGSERTLSFSELVSFGSIEAAREHIIEKEVETVLRKSHSEQFDWLESTFGIKLREGLSTWGAFIEITERRNLFVHTGGKVSAQYLKVCAANKVSCIDLVRGDQLQVKRGYYERAYEVIYEIAVKLAHVFWRKVKPEERKLADEGLLSISYDLLTEEKYALAKALLDFSTNVLKMHASSDYRMRFVVNQAQAYKWSGDEAQSKNILSKEDFSALNDEFKLAEAVLKDDFPAAIGMVKKLYERGSPNLGDYREWPLFRELRKQEGFGAVILEVFGEPLNKIDVAAVKSEDEVGLEASPERGLAGNGEG